DALGGIRSVLVGASPRPDVAGDEEEVEEDRHREHEGEERRFHWSSSSPANGSSFVAVASAGPSSPSDIALRNSSSGDAAVPAESAPNWKATSASATDAAAAAAQRSATQPVRARAAPAVTSARADSSTRAETKGRDSSAAISRTSRSASRH